MRTLILAVALSVLVRTAAGACGGSVPSLGAGLDELLKVAELAPAELTRARELQTQMKLLDASGQARGAREAEEQAMELLGYKKAWLRCGPGSFRWVKVRSNPSKEAM